jgi:hypothetical protein
LNFVHIQLKMAVTPSGGKEAGGSWMFGFRTQERLGQKDVGATA